MSRLAELGIAERLGLIVLTGVVALVLVVVAQVGRQGVNQTRQAGGEVARTAEELRGLVGAFGI